MDNVYIKYVHSRCVRLTKKRNSVEVTVAKGVIKDRSSQRDLKENLVEVKEALVDTLLIGRGSMMWQTMQVCIRNRL